MRVRIASHNMGRGSRNLAEALSERLGQRVLRLRREGSRFLPRSGDVLINWGRGSLDYLPALVINQPQCVANAQCKLETFRCLEAAGVSIPEHTTDRRAAVSWLNDEVPFMARIHLRGSAALGVYYFDGTEDCMDVEDARLFTKYIKKTAEYRVHVVQGKVIDYAQKKARRDMEGIDFQIRSYNNGWIFAREDVNPPSCVLEESTKAVAALSLDFGAVDVIYNQHYDRAYVLEVNTAPGLEGTTIQRYADALTEVISNEHEASRTA